MKMKMKLLAPLLAALLVAPALATSSDRPLVFDAQVSALAGDCHALTSESACLSAHCWWCKSAAVRSSCYSESEAQQLPPAVFQCDKAPSASLWALSQVL